MYHEILRLLEADNKSHNNSKGSIHSSTTISSFTSSRDTNIKKPRRFMSIHTQPNLADNQLKSYEFKFVSPAINKYIFFDFFFFSDKLIIVLVV